MTISNTAKAQVFQQEGGGFLELIVLTHPDLATPLRFVNNNEDIVSGGETYTAFPFSIMLPKDKDRVAPSASIRIDNVSRQIGQLIRQLVTAPLITISIVRLDDFDTVEQQFPPLQLRNVEYDSLTVSGELTVDDMMREPYPQRTFSPSEFPGVHQ